MACRNDSFANLVYLGVWGTVLAVGILGSGRRLADMARSLAMWMLIILVFVAGYQYRYELQDFANRDHRRPRSRQPADRQ